MKKEDMNCSFNNILDVVKNHFSIDSCLSCDYEEHYDQIYYLKLSLFLNLSTQAFLSSRLLEVQLIVQPHHAKRMQCAMVHVL